jgi:hypothetical protein
LLDRERGFGLTLYRRADRPQLRGAAQGPVDEEAVNDRVDAERQIGIIGYELVRHRAGEAVASTVGIETQQMLAIGLGFADPQFADQPSGRQRVTHGRILWS